MALLSRLRIKPNLHTHHHHHHRHFSILNPDSTPITTKQKTRTALSLLKSEKNPQRILDICREASLTPEFHLDRIAFSVAISNLTQSNNFDFVRTFLEELKARPDLRNDRFLSHSMILYGQAGMLDQAVRTFKEMEDMGVAPTTKSLNALLVACLIAKKYGEVDRVFLEFPKTYGVKPDLDTYNTVIKAFCESGKSSSSYSTFAEMERKGIRPNATTFGIMLAGFYREERFEDVGKVLELMEKHGQKPGLSTYNIRIQSLCKLKKSSEANSLFKGMLSKGIKPNAVSYHHLIHGFGNEGNVEELKRLFNDMRQRGCEPDSACYFTIVHFLCKCGEFDTALKACKASMSKDWYPNFTTMKTLVEGLVSISKVEEAREIVAKMMEKFTANAVMWKEIEDSLPK